jgi:hypothetical protein
MRRGLQFRCRADPPVPPFPSDPWFSLLKHERQSRQFLPSLFVNMESSVKRKRRTAIACGKSFGGTDSNQRVHGL